VTTIMQAEMSGTVAGMSSNISREDIPVEFAQRQALREAWEEAFDKMRQELRGTPVEAPKGAKEPTEGRKPRKPKEPARKAVQPVPTVAEKPKRMADILPELHHEFA
jgi:hypothetical protein